MKIKITETGVYDQNGKRVPVGTEVEVRGDTMPAWLENKGRILSEKKGRTAVTNPAKEPVQDKAD